MNPDQQKSILEKTDAFAGDFESLARKMAAQSPLTGAHARRAAHFNSYAAQARSIIDSVSAQDTASAIRETIDLKSALDSEVAVAVVSGDRDMAEEFACHAETLRSVLRNLTLPPEEAVKNQRNLFALRL